MGDLVEKLRTTKLLSQRNQMALQAEAADEIARLREALEPFVVGAAHTQVFLRSREKMHPTGQELYQQDVDRARVALQRKEPQG